MGRGQIRGHKYHFGESLPAVLDRKEAVSECVSKVIQVETELSVGFPSRMEEEGYLWVLVPDLLVTLGR